jgi:hypothetical protein
MKSASRFALKARGELVAGPKTAEHEAAPVAAGTPFRGSLTPARCKKFVRGKVASRLEEICDELVRKAQKGDVAAVKTLLQMASLDKEDSKEPEAITPLAKQLAFVKKTVAGLQQDRSE